MEVSGQLHAPATLPSGKEPGTHWMGGWVGPRASGHSGVEKNFWSLSGLKPLIIQLIAQDYTSDLSWLLL